jgi:diguanylate cyclase (GGDEF)-like protein
LRHATRIADRCLGQGRLTGAPRPQVLGMVADNLLHQDFSTRPDMAVELPATAPPPAPPFDATKLLSWQRQVSASLLWVGAGIVIMVCLCLLGDASWLAVAIWGPLSFAMSLYTKIALSRGWTLGRNDPTLTLHQIAYSCASTATCYSIAGSLRAVVLPMLMLALVFSIFALPTRKVRALVVYNLVMFAAVMGVMSWWQPERHPWKEELLTFFVLLVVLSAFAVLGGRLSDLRAALGHQKIELQQALARIAEIAHRDELTGLFNRRRMGEILDAQRINATRGEGFVVAIVDLDKFKSINDTYGHAVGDIVLRQFAELAKTLLRTGDILARWGGEEFLLVISTNDPSTALAVAERLRRQIAATPVALPDGTSIRYTVSIGLAPHLTDESTPSTIERADSALYRAKSSGRDRVEFCLAS